MALCCRRRGGVLEPRLATSWKVLDDQVTWEFKLREGVTFHDGEPFNAESVKYTVEKVLNEKLRWWAFIATIKEVKIVDDYTVHIVTYAPDPLLPGRLMLFMLPPKGVEEAGGLDEWAKKPAGTGSYIVTEFLPQERTLMEYWPDSWRVGVIGVPDKPLEIEWVHMPDAAARIAALRAGDIDVALDVPFDEVAALEEGGFVVTSVVEASRYMKNDLFDELLEASRHELDPDKRLVMLQEMAAIIHEEAPVLFLVYQARAHVMNPRVKGLELRPDRLFYVDFVSLEE